jgi:N-methylhydantoinase B
MFSTTIGAGDVFYHRTAGGGGLGNPLERDPKAVAADVADEKVSALAARERYGVILREDASVDDEATRQERDARAS